MLHFPPEFWRILNFFSSARGKLPILPYPALCCLQYFPRTNDKYQSPYLVKHVSMIYHIVSPCNNYYNSCFIIFCCFISFYFLLFSFIFFSLLYFSLWYYFKRYTGFLFFNSHFFFENCHFSFLANQAGICYISIIR